MASIRAFSSRADARTSAICRSRHSREPISPRTHSCSTSRQAGSASLVRISSVTSIWVTVPSKSQKTMGRVHNSSFMIHRSELAFVHQPLRLSPLPERSRGQEPKRQLIHPADMIGPDLRVARLDVAAHGLFDGGRARPVRKLQAKL